MERSRKDRRLSNQTGPFNEIPPFSNSNYRLRTLYPLQLAALISENRSRAKLIEGVHETVGTLGYFLIELHAAAALFHHYVIRDNAHRRMLPSRE